MEERGAGAAVLLRYFDRHHPEPEELVDERPGQVCLLIHVADPRPDFGVREFVNAVAKELFVFRERRQGSGGFPRYGHDRNAIIAKNRSSAGSVAQWLVSALRAQRRIDGVLRYPGGVRSFAHAGCSRRERAAGSPIRWDLAVAAVREPCAAASQHCAAADQHSAAAGPLRHSAGATNL